MRSSKSRSRSKANRPRTLGNIINRVFDSSGPEGKVRGTPQQIIEKYQMLARDAQLSNDRVAAENFSQHAEHYTRMLAEAQREMAAEQDARQQQYQQNNQNGGQNQPRVDRPGEYRERQDFRDRPDRNADRPDRGEFRQDRGPRDLGTQDQPETVEVIDLGAAEDTGLIETPEARIEAAPAAAPMERAPKRQPEPAKAPEAAAEDRPQPPRRPRAPRKPKSEAKPDGTDGPPREAAE
jgi:hypothetical protein